jgi:hypothetical protein
MTRFIVACLLLFSAALSAGCAVQYSEEEGMDYSELVSELRDSGASVETMPDGVFPGDNPIDTLFSGTGKRLKLDGETVAVLEYADSETAKSEAKFISRDGYEYRSESSGTIISINWFAPPHFYQKGRIIVQYVGENREITDLLEDLLGRQFAGQGAVRSLK